MGVIIAGSMTEGVKHLVELVKDWGGKGESTILGYGWSVPSPNAALVNGYSAVVLDYDDFHDLDFIHVSRAIIPASLAIAERRGGVHGKDFITAIALGSDLACRLSRAAMLHLEFGFDMCVPNYFGAAAAAGKLLGIDEEGLRNALGIALMQASGAGSGVHEGTSTKGLHGGLQAKAGVMAALMAENGLTATSDPIEGKKGFYQVFHRNIYRPGLITLDLGKVFEGVTNSQKPYPCCRWSHASIDATLALINEYDIKPDDVEEVIVHVGPFAHFLCEPLELRQRPVNAVQSQFSIPWAIAIAILYRKVGIQNFSEAAIRDTKALEMTRKIVPRLAPQLSNIRSTEPAIVEIHSKNGEVYSKRIDYALGSPENSMSFDDVAQKYKDCCSFSFKPISTENQDKVIEMIARLEEITDVCQITSLLD